MADAYLPSALLVMGAFQAFVAPKSSSADFWEMAKKCEKALQDYVHRLLRNAASYFKSTKFTDIIYAMRHIVDATAAFRISIKGALDARHGHITFDTLTEELEGIFTAIVKDLEIEFPPPDKAPGHAERAKMVDKILDDTALALIKLVARYGIEEEVVTTYVLALKPHVHALTVAVGDINDQHPQLFPTLMFSVVALLIPESWILGRLLSLFGFGPARPVKSNNKALKPRDCTTQAQLDTAGSATARLQWRFWGAVGDAGTIQLWAGIMGKL